MESLTKMVQLQAEMLVGELVAGGSFTGMQSEMSGHIKVSWMYGAIFLFVYIEPSSRDAQTAQSQKASHCVCFFDRIQPFYTSALLF